MAIVKSNPGAETVGLAPKVAYTTLVLLAVGVLLCVLDQTGVIDVGDELWLGIIGSAIGALGIGTASPAAVQRAKDSV
jgi:hypothetical protein